MCKNILKPSSDVIIIGDDNIVFYNNYNNYNNFRDSELKDTRDDFVINIGLVMHNRKPTFHRGNQNSYNDHLYTNCPAKISNCTMHNDILSDHLVITFNFSNKHLHYSPKYKYKRDYSS